MFIETNTMKLFTVLYFVCLFPFIALKKNAPECPNLRAMPNFDTERYLGQWYFKWVACPNFNPDSIVCMRGAFEPHNDPETFTATISKFREGSKQEQWGLQMKSASKKSQGKFEYYLQKQDTKTLKIPSTLKKSQDQSDHAYEVVNVGYQLPGRHREGSRQDQGKLQTPSTSKKSQDQFKEEPQNGESDQSDDSYEAVNPLYQSPGIHGEDSNQDQGTLQMPSTSKKSQHKFKDEPQNGESDQSDDSYEAVNPLYQSPGRHGEGSKQDQGTLPVPSTPKKSRRQFKSRSSRSTNYVNEFNFPHWVLDTDYDSYAIVWGCREKGASNNIDQCTWILTRQSKVNSIDFLMKLQFKLQRIFKHPIKMPSFQRISSTECPRPNVWL